VRAHTWAEAQSVLAEFPARNRLAVERDQPRVVALEAELEDARISDVQKPNADALVAAGRPAAAQSAVDGDGGSDFAVMAALLGIGEIGIEAAIVLQFPIAQHPHEFAIDARRLLLIDDENAGEPASELLGAVCVRVIPIGAGIDADEAVGKQLV